MFEVSVGKIIQALEFGHTVEINEIIYCLLDNGNIGLRMVRKPKGTATWIDPGMTLGAFKK